MNTIDKAIADFLESQNIKFYASYCGFRFRDDAACDEWRVGFESGKGNFETEFYQGVGHRKLTKFYENNTKVKLDFTNVKNHLTPSTKNNIRVLLEISDAASPSATSVLHCIILDASALDSSFEYWCADYGYDSDRISHFNIYQHCCKNGKEMRKVFTQAQINQIQEMLQDY